MKTQSERKSKEWKQKGFVPNANMSVRESDESSHVNDDDRGEGVTQGQFGSQENKRIVVA